MAIDDELSLFSARAEAPAEAAGSATALNAPLAERMRPRRLEEFRGQEGLVRAGSPLRRSIEEDRVHSFILWGPPGTGKTTLARIVAEHTEREFIALSAV